MLRILGVCVGSGEGTRSPGWCGGATGSPGCARQVSCATSGPVVRPDPDRPAPAGGLEDDPGVGAVAAGDRPGGLRRGRSPRAGAAARSRRPAPASPSPERPRRWSRSRWPARWAPATASAGGGIDPAVVEAVRQHQQVAGEPVAADVGDLPGLLGVRRRERLRDGPAAFGAAGVVAAVGAHREHRPVGRRQPRRLATAERGQVEVEQVLGPLDRRGLEPGSRAGRRTPRTPGGADVPWPGPAVGPAARRTRVAWAASRSA